MYKILLLVFLSGAFYSTQAQVVANPPNDLESCDLNNDGSAIFDLSQNDAVIIGSQDPNDLILTYHETQIDAIDGVFEISNPQAYQNIVNPQTVFARLESLSNSDFEVVSFELIVHPIPSFVTPTPIIETDDDGDGFELFDLTSRIAEIIDGEPDVSLTFYETLADAQAKTNAIPNSAAYQNAVTPQQTIYVNVENNLTGCYIIVELLLIIDTPPTVPGVIEDLAAYDDNGDGFALFDLTEKIPEIVGTQTGLEVTFYETFDDSENKTNDIDQPEQYQNISNPQTIYVRVETQYGSFSLTDFVILADPTLSLSENNHFNVELYPNPATEMVSIQSAHLTSETVIILYDIKGKVVLSEKLMPQNNSLSLPLEGLTAGMYYLHITSESMSVHKKLILK